MDRAQILRQVLTLAKDRELSPSAAGDFAGVDPETKEELFFLWLEAVGEDLWSLPEDVLLTEPGQEQPTVVLSAEFFVAGYMLARRELIEAADELGFDLSAGEALWE